FSDLDTASRIWNLAAGLTQPIFQGGRLKDEAMAKEAQAEAAVWDLAQAVLAAMKEVEDAMDNETALAFQEAALTDAVLEAVKTSEYFLTRYRSGLDNIQTLLIAREQEMNIKTSLTDIKAARMTNRIDMALALGLGV
ncbi:MAG: TolC family protein, partial [Desulfobacterales bacterium]|nr:TolC family protein [Desulfobacterales bacterium]